MLELSVVSLSANILCSQEVYTTLEQVRTKQLQKNNTQRSAHNSSFLVQYSSQSTASSGCIVTRSATRIWKYLFNSMQCARDFFYTPPINFKVIATANYEGFLHDHSPPPPFSLSVFTLALNRMLNLACVGTYCVTQGSHRYVLSSIIQNKLQSDYRFSICGSCQIPKPCVI